MPARHREGLHEMRAALERLLADTMTIRDLYSKHGEQTSGPLAEIFQLICDRHRVEHARLVDLLAAHIRTLGGDAPVMAADIAASTRIPRPPRHREPLKVQLERLLDAHQGIAEQCYALDSLSSSGSVSELAGDRTALIASELILTGTLHVWLLEEHLRRVSRACACPSQNLRLAQRLMPPVC